VILGSAVNNDGAKKVGYTAPNLEAQAEVVVEALGSAGVKAESIGYVEAHGTGTVLGDPIEVAALSKAFAAEGKTEGECWLGSVKSNIGHLDAAAGVAGLIKTVLAVEQGELPPSLHYQTANPKIDFAGGPFRVNTELRKWEGKKGGKRRAGVSSFGMGGTNAHVIVEEAPKVEIGGEEREWQLLLVSARSEAGVEEGVARLGEHLGGAGGGAKLADVAFTLQSGRGEFEHRRMVVCRNVEEGIEGLRQGRDGVGVVEQSRSEKVGFLFPGQGAQYVGMGWELYQKERVFREQVESCWEWLKREEGIDLEQVIRGETEAGKIGGEAAEEKLKQTMWAQLALFVVELGLARQWMGWGIRPQAMLGHSIGEYVAACVAGVFTVEEGLRLVAERGRLMQEAERGVMLSVGMGEEELQPLLGEVELSAVNRWDRCVVGGRQEAVERLEKRLEEGGIGVQRLETSHAFHTSLLEPVLPRFRKCLEGVRLRAPQLPYVSNVSGNWIGAGEATEVEYWVRHLRQTVRFGDGLKELLKDKGRVLVEAGPGQNLSSLVRPQLQGMQQVVTSLGDRRRKQPEQAEMLRALGRLWLAGVSPKWEQFQVGQRCHRIPLPAYPFQRQRYWIESRTNPTAKTHQPAQKLDSVNWFYVPGWKESTWPQPAQNRLTSSSPVLVFAGQERLGTEFGKLLERNGRPVIIVHAGEQFHRIDARTYTLNPGQYGEHCDLVNSVMSSSPAPTDIVHFWNAASPEHDNHLYLGFWNLVSLAQALARRSSADPVRITVVTTNLHDVTGEETICPERAMILGPSHTIPQEVPNIRCRVIDVAIPRGTVQERALLEALRMELEADSEDHVIAYRGSHRWIQDFLPWRFNEQENRTRALRQGGVYLITGGLGKIGLSLARHLAKEFQAKLVLLSRSAFPERRAWQHLLASGTDDKVSKQISSLLEIERCEGAVRIVSADVGDPDQIKSAVQLALQEFGSLHGVIHAAGLVGTRAGMALAAVTPESCEQQFRPKIQGILALDHALQGMDLDFCVLISSLASILGGLGYTTYSSANAYMDAFARSRKQAGLPWTSINFDLWRFEEEGEEARVDFGMTESQGVEAFQRVLRSGYPQIAVSTEDLQTRIRQWIVLESVKPVQPAKKAYARPVLQSAYVAPKEGLEQSIAAVWRTVLGIEQIGVNDNFFELGGDSLKAIQLVAELKKITSVSVPVTRLFEAPTVASLALLFVPGSNESPALSQRLSRGERRRQVLSA
jgi:acyl transferase domain-containing protein/acyl carrier protein